MAARVDHRSLKDRNIDREPQVKRGKTEHMPRPIAARPSGCGPITR